MNILNKYFDHIVTEAAELFSSGWCNLECQYCYIPKTDLLKPIHKEIISCIKDGTYLKRIEELYGNDLTTISHWGTEPTLTISLFKDFYKQAIDIFPNLNKIHTSSNFMTNPKNLIDFISSLPTKRPLEIHIQISHDGPPIITDKNRCGGSADLIKKNSITFIKMVNEILPLHKIVTNFKPTITEIDIDYLSTFENCKNYYDYFEEYVKECIEANGNNMVDLGRSVDPTVVCPGNYNSNDGKKFFKLLQNQEILNAYEYIYITKPTSNYFYRIKDSSRVWKEYFTKQRMFTCSAGDSNMGIAPHELHLCHQTYYLKYDGYYEAIKEYGKRNLEYFKPSVDGVDSGSLNNLRDMEVVPYDDNKKIVEFLYRNRAYHDFATQRVAATLSIINEMVKAEQISKVYSDQYLSTIFAMVLLQATCPADIVTSSGNLHCAPISMVRLFGNGVFEKLILKIVRSM